MKKLLSFLFLVVAVNSFSQASSTREFAISFIMDKKDFEKTSFNFICHRGAVDVEQCELTTKKSRGDVIVTLSGRYHHIVGPPGFLMTICLQQNYLSGSGFNHTQNYYVHFDSAIGTNNERFDVNIGKVAPDKNYPFMLVKEVSGKLKIQKAMLPDGWQDIFLCEVANIITIKNP
ncbi:hypothetical protein [Flavobacterium sp.]|uniref:hypothetical protein n=1 Tax=Flavobacterium sp. TaxID=239 RepID=UPI0026178884|nr:hypothetical protein [Flavobacterium sp.]